MVWYEDGFFMVSMLLLIIEFFIVIVLGIRYQYMKNNHYNENVGEVEFIKFNQKNWANHACDQHFQRKIDLGEIEVLRKKEI